LKKPVLKQSRTSRPRLTQAQRADRYRLYEESVQNPSAEVDFLVETFVDWRGRQPRMLREDFCGSAALACQWVRRNARNTAVALDIDTAVLAWARANNLPALGAAARRLQLLEANVLAPRQDQADLCVATNFSYYLFTDRKTLRAYFRRVRLALADGGLFVLDAFGGYDAFRVLRERTPHRRHTYVWHQATYDPISGLMTCHIHFTFPDGSRMNKAFSYDWRLWTLPEIRELLGEAGFDTVKVYWQGADEKTGEGNGRFDLVEAGTPDAGWIAYLVASA
jgi:SAM-dependent methyltransferase